MKHRQLYFSLLALLLILGGLAGTGCNRDKDPPELPPPTVNSPELITTVLLHFTDTADTTQKFDVVFRDSDGEGGNAPSEWDSISLGAGKNYDVRIELLNESDTSDVEDITAEVLAEAADHIFCYTVTGVSVTIVRTDTDGTYEIGIQSDWTAGSTPAVGNVTVTLKHQPDSKDGTCTPGDTDVEIAFVTQIL